MDEVAFHPVVRDSFSRMGYVLTGTDVVDRVKDLFHQVQTYFAGSSLLTGSAYDIVKDAHKT